MNNAKKVKQVAPATKQARSIAKVKISPDQISLAKPKQLIKSNVNTKSPVLKHDQVRVTQTCQVKPQESSDPVKLHNKAVEKVSPLKQAAR